MGFVRIAIGALKQRIPDNDLENWGKKIDFNDIYSQTLFVKFPSADENTRVGKAGIEAVVTAEEDWRNDTKEATFTGTIDYERSGNRLEFSYLPFIATGLNDEEFKGAFGTSPKVECYAR